MESKKKVNEVCVLVLNIIITLGIVFVVFRLWDKDFHVPISFQNDGLGAVATVKSMIEGDGAWYRSYWSAPFGETNYMVDYILPLVIIKPITLFVKDAAVVINIFWLITYILTSITTYFLLRKIGIKYCIAVFGSIIYNFLPYHFLRIEHFWLCGCYIIPLSFFLLLDIVGVIKYDKKIYRIWKFNVSKHFLINICLCTLIGLNGIYYAVFTAILILCIGIITSINKRRIYDFTNSFIETIAIFVPILVTYVLPTVLFGNSQMSNQMQTRNIYDIERYALKISALLFPVQGHRIKAFAAFTEKYSEIFGLTNENYTVVLGGIMSLGFIISIIAVFCGKIFGKNKYIFRYIGLINILIIIICCQGGFANYIGVFLTTAIRCFNRMSIFIALGSLILICILLESLFSKFIFKEIYRIAVVSFLIVLGVLDQVPDEFGFYSLFDPAQNKYVLSFEEKEDDYYQLKEYFQYIQDVTGDDATIYIYPRHPFYVEDNKPFAPIKAYVCSDNLNWSYSEWNAEYDEWFTGKEQENICQLLNSISCLDMSGIMVDSQSFENESIFKEICKEIEDLVGDEPIVNKENNLFFYDISQYKRNYLSQFSDEKLDAINGAIKAEMENPSIQYIDNEELYLLSGEIIEDDLVVKSGDVQYGPYIDMSSGKYKITIFGDDLNNIAVKITFDKGKEVKEYTNLTKTNNMLSYEFELKKDTKNVEFISSCSSESYTIYGYFIERDNGNGFHDLKEYYSQKDLLSEANISTNMVSLNAQNLYVSNKLITTLDDNMILKSKETQYGPYNIAQKGLYEVEIEGENLSKLSPNVAYDFGKENIEISDVIIEPEKIKYVFYLPEDVENLEILLENKGDCTATISSYKYKKICKEQKIISFISKQ